MHDDMHDERWPMCDQWDRDVRAVAAVWWEDKFHGHCKGICGPCGGHDIGLAENKCCVESQDAVSLVSYEHSVVVYVMMPIM